MTLFSLRRLALAFCAIATLSAAPAAVRAEGPAARTPSPAGARAYVISPADGETVSSPVLVRFGLSGMGVAPASIQFPNTGHHHLMVDAPLPPFDAPIPNDKNHIHYGAGLTESKVELTPGKHTLQLLMGDYAHVPHDPPVYSEPITINVK
jgi:hypothetical protein